MLVKNEAALLRRTLPLLAAQDIELPFEVVVIDSGSTDGSVELVRDWSVATSKPHVRLHQIAPSDFHHGRTRNLAVSLARASVVVFLGGDAVPASTAWLRCLSAPVVADPDSLIVASYGRQLPRADADVGNLCRMTYNYGAVSVVKSSKSAMSLKELYFFSSVNCSVDVRRAGVPLFDESVPVNEDVTLSTRLIRAGWKIAYCADAAVEHSHNYSLLEILRRSFDSGVVWRKIGAFPRNGANVSADGFRYLATAAEILRRHGPQDWLTFALFFGASALGVQLGLHHRLLPRALARYLTRFGSV